MWTLTRNAVIALTLAALGACGSGHQEGATTKAPTAAARTAALNAANALSRNMVSAVSAVKPGSSPLPLQVKFELSQRPEVDQPLEVNLAVVPTTPNFDRIFGKVEGEDGLEVVGSGELSGAERPAEGVPIQYTVKVLPKQDGIYTLTATFSGVDTAGQVSTQAYAIPIIAGQGFPDLPSKPAPAAATPAKTAASPSRAPTQR